jgi:hypothetical protein
MGEQREREEERQRRTEGEREGKKVSKERRQHKKRLDRVPELTNKDFILVKGISTADRKASFRRKRMTYPEK